MPPFAKVGIITTLFSRMLPTLLEEELFSLTWEVTTVGSLMGDSQKVTAKLLFKLKAFGLSSFSASLPVHAGVVFY